jgi:ribonuclease J
VRLVPLGGLGEIGMNCLAVEQGGDILVVDCGIRFPHDDVGIDVVHPDFTWLTERADKVRGIFLTHGHEDHIGALPYLLGHLDVPVWGPPHALGLVRHRLDEHDYGKEECDLRVAQVGTAYDVGSFTVEPIRVSHSIVEASALRIGTDAGVILHTGDFNFDPDPPDGEPTDEARLRALAKDGVALLLSDSTNIDVMTPGVGERNVGRALFDIVEKAEGKVFIALFASNIQRLILLGEIARSTGRRICVLGRSLVTQIEIATNIGRLRWPSDLRMSTEEARNAPREQVLVLAGGTQGEPGSAMSRLAAGTHGELAIDPNDTVIFSSRIIPGNDLPAVEMMGDVIRRGAISRTRLTDPGVHTSGHATRSEQTKMIDLVEPRCFMPVHGTLHHLTRHGELARERGVGEVKVVENGTAVLLDGRTLVDEGQVPNGMVSVGMGGVTLSHDVIKERVELARTGLAVVSLSVDRKGALVGTPLVTTRGIAGLTDPGELRAVKATIAKTAELARRRRMTLDELGGEVRRAVRRQLFDAGGVRPVVEVHVLES